ncbi:MAG: alpha-hydroxy-acid oxidizing protein [Myxococcota bacterium]|nr:alpha-hydroxy-acid oxidizing protein [Myxococcota bacterium]
MKKWICEICNYIHEGETPPDVCPICGAGPDKFRPYEETSDTPKPSSIDSLEDARDNARNILQGICGVYPRCDGHQDRICQRQAYGGVIGLGGAGSGQSFAANVLALEKIKLRTQLVGEHFSPSTAFDFFGVPLAFPVMGASTSGMSRYNEAIDELQFCLDCLYGCIDAGTLSFRGDTFFYTEADHPGLTAIEQASGRGVQIFKPREQDVLKRLIERAESIGCPAVGVDLDGCGSTNMAKAGQPVFRKSKKEIEALVRSTSLPFIAKGVMIPEDALACLDAGAKAIGVSNHGGRVLDGTPGVADVVSDIAAAVNGRAMIIADGGVRTGYDAIKLLALGADVVLVGRDVIRAAIGGGQNGVALQMKHLKQVLRSAMVMTGTKSLQHIDNKVLFDAPREGQ